MYRQNLQAESLKEINRGRVFHAIQNARTVSRSVLAEQTGLSRATISTIADELLNVDLVREVGRGESTGGRPPVLLEFNPNAAFALGARMYDHSWGIVITNLDGRLIHRLDMDLLNYNPETSVDALRRGVQEITARIEDKTRLLPAIGLGTPGLVDVHTGLVKLAADVRWYDVPFRQMVEDALGLKGFISNRSKVGALAEAWYGSKRGVQNLIYISIGTGVAAGIVCRGQLYEGENSSAGELGHMTILPDGPLCPCGNRGCLQQLVSGPAIANRARERLRETGESLLTELAGHHPELITVWTVFRAAEQGDALAREIVKEVAGYLGIAIANLVNLFNPELIVLGGPVGRDSQVLLEPLQAEVRRRAMAYPLSVAQIITSTLGQDTGAIGAAILVLQHAHELFFAIQE